MSQEIAQLEALLARVQKNAALPRPGRAAFAPSAQPFAAPSAESAPSPQPAPVAFAAPEPIVVPAPEFPVPESVPPPPAYTDSVDDLLADPFPAASAPPPPPVDEQIPDVAVAAQSEHISGVMPVADIVEEPPEELLEDDIVEMSPTAVAVEAVVPEARPAADELDFEDEEDAGAGIAAAAEEEPPVSSSRSKVPGTMDEALAHAAAQMEIQEGREVPLKTPPPESGPQAAMAPMPPSPAPDLDELLEADILPVAGAHAAGPTTEQLGQTIDLEEARGPHLELDHPVAAAHEEVPPEELEVTLPGRQFGGGYQEDLMPPPEARDDLDAHMKRAGEETVQAPQEALGQYPSQQPDARTSGLFAATGAPSLSTESPAEAVSTVTIEAPVSAEFAPELLARPDLGPTPVAKFVRAESPRPSTFLELLDSSLALGRE